MKKVCFLIGNLNNSGGTERVTTLIANELSRKKSNVCILSLIEGEKPFFDLDANIDFYSLYKEKISFARNYMSVIWKIRNFIKDYKIDTLIVVDSISCIFTVPALFGLNVKHICWEHFNFNVNLDVKFRDIGRKWAARYCDYVVTLTKRDKELWDQSIKNIKAQIIPIANPSPFQLQENTPSLDYKKILCVGRLTYQKGFDLLIVAWAKIAHQLPDWKIIIVGSGEDELMLKQIAKDLEVENSIIFAGQQKNMDSFYRRASFFCMSSRFEGLPMVLLEAQSYGLPIVAFDCDTGPSEIVNNKTGILVPVEDVISLSKKIKDMATLKEKLYHEMSLSSFSSSKNFNINNIILKWESIL